jgi:hypothetical protein
MLPKHELDKLIAEKLNLPHKQYCTDASSAYEVVRVMSHRGDNYFCGYETAPPDYKTGSFWAQFGAGSKVLASTESLAIVCAALRRLGVDVIGKQYNTVSPPQS